MGTYLVDEEKSRCYLAFTGGFMKQKNIKKLVTIALLISLNVVLSRLVSIKALNFKISLTFITIVIAAYLYSYFGAIIVAFFGDLLGSLLFPIGPYNPLLSITAILSAIVYAFFFKKEFNKKKIIYACFVNRFIVSMLINTIIISLMYDLSFKATLLTRFYQAVVMFIIEVLLLLIGAKYIKRLNYVK